MATYVIAQARTKDAEKLAAYGQAAGPTIAEHGGEMVMRAPVVEVLCGNTDFERFLMIKFENADTARAWHNSDAYQALIPLRNEGADISLILIEAAD